MKRWILTEQPKEEIVRLSKELHIFPLTAQLLLNRGLSDSQAASAFLRKEIGGLYDPYLLQDMEGAVKRILDAIKNHEKITIYGDYDVDGVTSVCVVYRYLSCRGADVHYYIPNRIGEGYGLNREAIDTIYQDGTKLLITVDTGITAIEETKKIKELGMDIVITDHHSCRDTLPLAAAVINPRRKDNTYPFAALCGVGVAFKLICGIATWQMTDQDAKRQAILQLGKEYLELVAIGTVADVMPLKDENRIIVSAGLNLLQHTENVGISALMEAATRPAGGQTSKYPQKKKKMNTSLIGYTIAPRINAAGRISHAGLAVELFLTEDPQRAECIANELCEINSKRQDMENTIANEAFFQVDTKREPEKEKVLVLSSDHWHHGVIGIVSSRITERYHLPSILVSFQGDDPDEGKGSGRSVAGLNLVEALGACKDLLTKYGGHALAAGLSLRRENLEAFRERINNYAAKELKNVDLTPVLKVDAQAEFSQLSLPLAEELDGLEPFGTENPTPQFLTRNLLLQEIIPLSGGKHTKLVLCDNQQTMNALYFGQNTDDLPFYPGQTVDVVYQLSVNEFMNHVSLQLIVTDMDDSAKQKNELKMQQQIYVDIRNAKNMTVTDAIPTREDCKNIYRYLQSLDASHPGKIPLSPKACAGKLSIPYYRFLLAMDVFSDAGLVLYKMQPQGTMTVVMKHDQKEKIDLDRTQTMRLLHQDNCDLQ